MDKRFEKILILLMGLSFTFLIVQNAISPADGQSTGLENQYPGIMRFHVIANSDTKEDQDLKLKVRDYVLTRLQDSLSKEMLLSEKSMGEEFSESLVMKQFIENNLKQIEGWAYEGLEANNSKYDCKVSIGVRHIPAKYYDEIFFPEGNYEALTITIGEGKGQNWWCVVFPPLCLVENDDSSYRSRLDMSEEDKIQLKSKILEIMENSKRDKHNLIKGIYLQNAVDAFFVKKWVKNM